MDELEKIHKELEDIEKKITSLQYMLQSLLTEVWRLKHEAEPPQPIIETDSNLDDFMDGLI